MPPLDKCSQSCSQSQKFVPSPSSTYYYVNHRRMDVLFLCLVIFFFVFRNEKVKFCRGIAHCLWRRVRLFRRRRRSRTSKTL
jgi:hypothetical protein